jgi:hypothetical protein
MKNTCNNSEGSQDPEKQPTLVAGGQEAKWEIPTCNVQALLIDSTSDFGNKLKNQRKKVTQPPLMKSNTSPVQSFTLVLASMLMLLEFTNIASAQTIVQGNIGGTWTPAGNPYIAVANCTVTSTLILQPGVVFDIESNVTVTANGNLIQAVGTPTQRITIQGWPATTNYYNTIYVENETGTNRFKYCDFANAQTAIMMVVAETSSGYNDFAVTMPVEIMNCTFSNCVQEAIYGLAQGQSQGGGFPCFSWYTTDTLNPVIKNCVFNGTVHGCVINISGQSSYSGSGCRQTSTGYGYSYPIIEANLFQNLTGNAFLMQVGSYAGAGSSVFINNTMVNCGVGVNATDPWDATVEDCVFDGCTNAVMVSGSLSRNIYFHWRLIGLTVDV